MAASSSRAPSAPGSRLPSQSTLHRPTHRPASPGSSAPTKHPQLLFAIPPQNVTQLVAYSSCSRSLHSPPAQRPPMLQPPSPPDPLTPTAQTPSHHHPSAPSLQASQRRPASVPPQAQ